MINVVHSEWEDDNGDGSSALLLVVWILVLGSEIIKLKIENFLALARQFLKKIMNGVQNLRTDLRSSILTRYFLKY